MKSLRQIILEIAQANSGGVTAAAPVPGSINNINTNTNNLGGGIVNNNIASPDSNNNLGSPNSVVGSTSGNSSTTSSNPPVGSTSGNSSTTSSNPPVGSTSGNSFYVPSGVTISINNINTNTNILGGDGGGRGGGGPSSSGGSPDAGRAGRVSSVQGSAANETSIGLLQRSRLLNAQKESGIQIHQRLIQMLRNNQTK